MKKLLFTLTVILLVAAGCNSTFLPPEDWPSNYYASLATACKSDQCCISSARTMADYNYQIAKDGKCPAGFNKNQLICIESYVWCEPSKQQATIQQGVYGTVTLNSVNCMPPTTSNCPKTQKVARHIYIREPANIKNMSKIGGDYLQNPPRLIKETNSANNGIYQIALPAGTYSVFVDDEGKEYCNSFAEQGKACQITVGTGAVEYNITIDHAAY